MIAEVREPSSDCAIDEKETLHSLQAKFEKLKLLSEADKEVSSSIHFITSDDQYSVQVIAMMQGRAMEQKRQFEQRKSVFLSVQEKFKELSSLAQRDRQLVQDQTQRIAAQIDEINKIREEKTTLTRLNEALREQVQSAATITTISERIRTAARQTRGVFGSGRQAGSARTRLQ
jgi:DNA polymerase III alpha subunit (gram-positive type)